MGGDGRDRQACSNGALLELHRGMRGGEPTGLRRCGAESAIERLRQAETRINDAETARARAEDSLVRLTARLQEAENKVAGAERQMRSAEVRAMQAEKAVTQINDAIRAQLLGLQRNQTNVRATSNPRSGRGGDARQAVG